MAARLADNQSWRSHAMHGCCGDRGNARGWVRGMVIMQGFGVGGTLERVEEEMLKIFEAGFFIWFLFFEKFPNRC